MLCHVLPWVAVLPTVSSKVKTVKSNSLQRRSHSQYLSTFKAIPPFPLCTTLFSGWLLRYFLHLFYWPLKIISSNYARDPSRHRMSPSTTCFPLLDLAVTSAAPIFHEFDAVVCSAPGGRLQSEEMPGGVLTFYFSSWCLIARPCLNFLCSCCSRQRL